MSWVSLRPGFARLGCGFCVILIWLLHGLNLPHLWIWAWLCPRLIALAVVSASALGVRSWRWLLANLLGFGSWLLIFCFRVTLLWLLHGLNLPYLWIRVWLLAFGLVVGSRREILAIPLGFGFRLLVFGFRVTLL